MEVFSLISSYYRGLSVVHLANFSLIPFSMLLFIHVEIATVHNCITHTLTVHDL